jgi:7-cyano-7-deazaguanine synthase in queuosine biosynthesis
MGEERDQAISSCALRIKGFKKAGVKDPIEYAVPIEW